MGTRMLTGMIGAILLFGLMSLSTVHALQEQSILWSSNTLFQGDSGSAIVTLVADNAGCGCLGTASQSYIKEIAIQFDWQKTPGPNNSLQVGKNVTSGATVTYQIPISIPSNVSVGLHTYTLLYLDDHDVANSLWAGSLRVHDAYERVYNDGLAAVQGKLNESVTSSFQDAETKSLIAQARADVVQAQALSQSGRFQEAAARLNAASALYDQAVSAASSVQAQSQLQVPFMALAGALVIALALSAVFLRLRAKGHPRATADSDRGSPGEPIWRWSAPSERGDVPETISIMSEKRRRQRAVTRRLLFRIRAAA